MCGIAGFWRYSANQRADWLEKTALSMANTLVHRGPDDSGVWSDPDAGIAFGHRRLSIIDVSDHGHQPMLSSDGRYVIIYNGEVYNFQEIRQQLGKLGHRFRGHSDTEVMLASFVEWGVGPSLERFNGMFAFALWDRRDRHLWLARDRIGEKPLYYGVQNGILFFASELKAIRAHPDFIPEIDRDALVSYLRFSYVPAPHSIYKSIKKLLPGHLLCIKSPTSEDASQTYWFLEDAYQSGIREPFHGSDDEAADELESKLKQTVKSRMISDVPLGAFLSGGIDSSTIVALMQSQSDRSVNTFTIGFHEQKFNEAVYAKKVAQHLGTNHTELYVSPQDAMDVIPKLPQMYDEPFADSSQIPTHLISALAREHVTVVLSGDGGDELFAGYNRYIQAKKHWKSIRAVPNNVRKLMSLSMMSVPSNIIETLYKRFEFLFPPRSRISLPSEKFRKAAHVIAMTGLHEVYKRLVSIIYMPEDYARHDTESTSLLDNTELWNHSRDFVSTMQKLDLLTYLPDDLMAKVDRASMAVSLETRVPFLDHNIVEFVMKLPLELKLHNGVSKRLLRQVLYRYVPEELIERPKMGFSVPIGEWMRDPLQDWAYSLIDFNRLKNEGYFRPEPVLKMWNEHSSGRSNWGHQLWNLLMFQSWLDSHS